LRTSQGTEVAVSEIDKLRNRLNTLDGGVKIRQANQELEKQLELYKRSAEIQATALKNNNHKILSDDQKVSLQNYLNSVNALNVSTPQLQHTMRQLSLDFREVSASAETASHGQMSMLESFRTAMTKFPVWMAATTAFYGSLNALKGAISVIVEVDTRLTNLKKVMDQNTNFENVMDNARISAEKFGKTLTEVLDAYTEFAKQGYKEQDLYNLGNAGLITSNVGEIDASQAAQYLTSAMVQYNVATKDSMKVIDAWNNVSNKNATTVEKLASGMSKAGSTAHAFGLDMDHLNAIIGTVTAATKQSGNEVGNFVKSILPRLLGQPAQDALKSLNINFIDQKTGDMRNVVDIYGEVAEKVKNISKVEKMAVMEGLAGKMHISRMTALIDNWDMYNKILKDSKNSEGSAAQENERYMKSLEARIASMKVAIQEIALSLGKAFLD
jgi:TP901 family phage tail tape measure protein